MEEESKGEEAALLSEGTGAKLTDKKTPPPIPPRTYKAKASKSGKHPAGPGSSCRALVVDVKIPGSSVRVDLYAKAQKPFAVYYMQVGCDNGQGWTVEKRFSELFAFNKEVRAQRWPVKARFPSRLTRKAPLSAKLVEHRRAALETYMLAVVATGECQEALRRLVQADEELAATAGGRARAGSFRARLANSGSFDHADRVMLKARELMQETLKGQPNFVRPVSTADLRAQELSKKALLLTGRDETERICLQLGQLVAQQQAKVDSVVAKLLRVFPEKQLLDLKRSDEFGAKLLSRVRNFLAQVSSKVLAANESAFLANYEQGYSHDYHSDVLHRLVEVSMIQRHPALRSRLEVAAASCDDVGAKDARVTAKTQFLASHFGARGVPPALFGASVHPRIRLTYQAAAQTRMAKFAWGWEDATGILMQLDDPSKCHTPSAMVEIVLQCVNAIHEGLAPAPPSSTNSTLAASARGPPRALGADDFIPIFFYVVACANLARPCMGLQCMTTLASERLLDSEAKYWLTVLESGLHFISRLEFDV